MESIQLNLHQLIDAIPVSKIVLLKKRNAPHRFEQKVFSHFAGLCKITYSVKEFGDQETSYGKLPLCIVNDDHIVHLNDFISFSQAITNPTPDQYLMQKSVVNSCLALLDFNRLQQLEQQSEYWLLFSPLKRLRQYLNYRHQLRQLAQNNISSDSRENTSQIQKVVATFEQLLIVGDEFSRTVQYLCIDFIVEHNNSICTRVKQSIPIMQMYLRGIPDMGGQKRAMMSELKKIQNRPQPPKANPEEGVETWTKALAVLSLVWIPWIMKA